MGGRKRSLKGDNQPVSLAVYRLAVVTSGANDGFHLTGSSICKLGSQQWPDAWLSGCVVSVLCSPVIGLSVVWCAVCWFSVVWCVLCPSVLCGVLYIIHRNFWGHTRCGKDQAKPSPVRGGGGILPGGGGSKTTINFWTFRKVTYLVSHFSLVSHLVSSPYSSLYLCYFILVT